MIYRSLPKWESLDPFGEEGQQQLRVTNIRIRLLKRQPCPCQAKDLASAHQNLPTRHFAIYDLIVKGSCFCNGHAEQCVPAPGYRTIRDRTHHVVRSVRLFLSQAFTQDHFNVACESRETPETRSQNFSLDRQRLQQEADPETWANLPVQTKPCFSLYLVNTALYLQSIMAEGKMMHCVVFKNSHNGTLSQNIHSYKTQRDDLLEDLPRTSAKVNDCLMLFVR